MCIIMQLMWLIPVGGGGSGEKIGFLQGVPFSADSSVWWVAGFVGVYIAGHILEATKSWSAVFNQTAGVCMVGWVVFIVFGTGKQIVWELTPTCQECVHVCVCVCLRVCTHAHTKSEDCKQRWNQWIGTVRFPIIYVLQSAQNLRRCNTSFCQRCLEPAETFQTSYHINFVIVHRTSYWVP